jgi:hypothetical protein
MIRIKWTILFSYLITFLLGVTLGWFLWGKQEVITNTVIQETVVEKVDTFLVEKKIYIKSPATTLTVHQSPDTHNGADSAGSIYFDEVAHWDTLTKDGFTADINYYKKGNFFENRFVIPERKIIKEKIITQEVTVDRVISKMPAYVFSAGARMNYQEDLLKGYPFLSLAANNKFLFINYSIAVTTLADIKGNGISIIPELEGRFNIPFD